MLAGLLPLALALAAHASVTVYSQLPLADSTKTASLANYTAAAAYDPTVLTPPTPPSPATTAVSIALQPAASSVSGLSIPHGGDFLGFSIEFSVITNVIGLNSSFIQVPFLNLMQALVQRGGRVNVRVGGNTQDYATLVPSLPNNKIIQKQSTGNTNPTETPTLDFTAEVLYLLGNVSALTNVHWYLGIPLNDTANLRLAIAEVGEAVLGDKLIGLQVGNEPDLYAAHGHRASSYGPYDYFGDFGVVVAGIAADDAIPTKNTLIAPNLSGTWTPEEVWDTGFISSYTGSLGALAVEHYPSDNCFAEYGIGAPVSPQDVFGAYLNHTAAQQLVQPYLNSTAVAQAAGKPFLMFETNTASCGGFPGISDAFGSSLWALDYALQMAYTNFSGANLHVSGQDVYYNPFTPPPTNESTYHQWTVAPLFYANLAMAETLGTANTSQVVDLFANSASIYTPAYAVYEGGSVAKVALFNYVSDPSGASDYTATISVGGGNTGAAGATPSSVQVKVLAAPSVSEHSNITWAGQTYGGYFQSDGRLQGAESVQTVQCDTTAGTCQVKVPAPSYVLVFLTGAAYEESNPSSTVTFATTSVTKTANTATINASVLATSNGHSGSSLELGSTSKGSANAARAGRVAPGLALLISVVCGAALVGRALVR
ncbi:hypothetical protein HWV62_31241 [Athelia sp. TMB]|nr:hypothetical protein HWV62_31241 [Athelia sp. TMB]